MKSESGFTSSEYSELKTLMEEQEQIALGLKKLVDSGLDRDLTQERDGEVQKMLDKFLKQQTVV